MPPRDFKASPIVASEVGQWLSWTGDPGDFNYGAFLSGAPPSAGPLPGGMGGGAAGAAPMGSTGGAGRGGDWRQGMQGPYGGPGGGRGGGMGGGAGDGGVGAAPAPRLARARTPWHTARRPGAWAGRRFPQAPGRARTPFHDAHPAFHPGATVDASGGDTGGGRGVIDRSRMRKELENNPELRKRVMTIAANENNDPRAQQAVMESLMNRSLMSGRPLSEEAQFTWRRGDRGYYDAKAGGIRRGQAAVADPRRRAGLEKRLDAVLAGSNISNYATGNASGAFVERRIRQGMFPGGVRFRASGETFVGESRGQGWKKWHEQASRQGGGATGEATATGGVGGGIGAPGRQGAPSTPGAPAPFSGGGRALPANQAARLGFQPIRSGAGTVTVKSPSGAAWQVAPRAAPQFRGFLRDLEATGYRARSSGGWNYRNVRGSSRLSQHAYGTAIDINAAANRLGSARTNMPKETSALARKWGLSWGLEWRGRKDPMHFEISRMK